MRKKIFQIVTALIIAVVVALNVSVVRNDETTEISLRSIEALGGEWNDWNDWLSQGFTKDERELQERCPTEQISGGGGSVTVGYGPWNGTIGGSGGSSQTNPPERTDIRCPSGDENCTPVSC